MQVIKVFLRKDLVLLLAQVCVHNKARQNTGVSFRAMKRHRWLVPPPNIPNSPPPQLKLQSIFKSKVRERRGWLSHTSG